MQDRTSQAVAAQVAAMGCEAFEVGVYDATRERMLTKVWDRETVLKSISYLKYQNMQGNHIYIRPAGAHNLTLMDDLSAAKVTQLSKDGYAPAVVVETSPNNFQAWLKHDRVLATDLSTRTSRELAARYGGDPGSADWRHYGRLAGFTNCKPKYKQPNGFYPFVVLREATGKEYGKTDELLADVIAKQEAEKSAEQERRSRFAAAAPTRNSRIRISKTVNDFRNDPRYGGDLHRAELGYATYAISRGATEREVVAAIMTRDLSHKGTDNRQTEYAERTVKKAIEITRSQPVRTQGKGRGA
ncbi:MAG: RepB family DNA primase [Pseudomonadota bacterium]|nr:RepB family DNA primase [Pseudomonadota bacterium]